MVQPESLAVFDVEAPQSPAQRIGRLRLVTALRRQALALAAALRDNGIGDGDTVAVVGPKTAEQVPALLGILAAGLAGGASVVVAFGFVLIGISRYNNARQGDTRTRATYLLLAALGALFCLAALIPGFLAMTKK